VSPTTAKTSRETEPPVFPTVPVMGPVLVVHEGPPELLLEAPPLLVPPPLLLLEAPELLAPPELLLLALPLDPPLELAPELLPELPPPEPPKSPLPPELLLHARATVHAAATNEAEASFSIAPYLAGGHGTVTVGSRLAGHSDGAGA
jgi:hypothetical protein